MFDRFSERSRTVMGYAFQEAKRFGHAYIGTAHILLGCLRLDDGIAASVLGNLGVDLDRARAEVVALLPETGARPEGQLPFTPRAKAVLERALDYSESLRHNFIGTEHLLLGLLAEEEGTAARVLRILDLDFAEIRSLLEDLLETRRPEHAPGRAPAIVRERETEQVLRILCRRERNRPVIVGDSAFVRDAVVDTVAQLLASGHVPPRLKDMRLFSQDRTDPWLRTSGGILLMRELDSFFARDAQRNAFLARVAGELPLCIGTCGADGYEERIAKDAALNRIFAPVRVRPTDSGEVLDILRRLRGDYEEHHGVRFPDDVLAVVVNLSMSEFPDGPWPDIALEILDDAGSLLQIRMISEPSAEPPAVDEALIRELIAERAEEAP